MAIEKNNYRRLLAFIDATKAPNKTWVRAEGTLAITSLFFLIIGALVLLQPSILGTLPHHKLIGFSCLGASALFPFTKSVLFLFNCCFKESIQRRSGISFRCSINMHPPTDEQINGAIGL